MKPNTKDLTQGPLGKQVLFFSLPLMLSNVLQILFNMSDVAIVGKFAGPGPLGSVGSTVILVALFTGFLIGMGSGVNVLTARCFGSRQEQALTETVHTAALVCLLTGIAVLLVGLASTHAILSLMNTKPELMEGAVLYTRIYFLGMPALALYNFGNAVFSAIGNTKKPLFYLVLAGVINVLLNLFFVIVCGMDVAGVALASVIAQYISAVLILVALLRCRESYGLSLSKLKLHRDQAVAILRIGLPAGFQGALFQIANLFIQAGVNSFDAVMVEGNSAAANADSLVYNVMAAFYTACGSFIGQNYGAGNKGRVWKSYLISLAYSFGAGALLGLGLAACGPAFLSLFTDEPAVVAAGMKRLTVMGCSYAVSAFMDCTISASRGLGRSLVPTVIVILGSCIFRIAWIYTVFAYFGTIASLYLLYVFSWSITAVAEILYFRGCYRRQMAAL